MLTTKELFNEIYTIEKMNRNSLTLVNNSTADHLFISRNAYNALLRGEAVDMREVEKEWGCGHISTWLEVLVWKSI
jgi:hypothetical protein